MAMAALLPVAGATGCWRNHSCPCTLKMSSYPTNPIITH